MAAGELPETLRFGRPGRTIAFGKRDVVSPQYAKAVAAARASGFEAIQRLGGGRPAAYHEGTLVFGHAAPDPDPKPGIELRFQLVAGIVAAALARLGIDARVGEVPGEYCPGAHSVNARGAVKLLGLGQRLIRGGAHVGGVVVVDGAGLVNEALAPVYELLGLGFDPAVTGSVSDEAPGATPDMVRAAILDEYAARNEIESAELDAGTLALARSLAPEHLPPV